MKKSIPPNSFDFITSDKITCWTHPKQNAFSFCKDCNTFCCELENCGRPHLFHNMDNLETCMKKDISPIITEFQSKNFKLIEFENAHLKNLSDLKGFKNNLDIFIQEEKQKTHKTIENIKSLLNNIYTNYVYEIQGFSDKLKTYFDILEHNTRRQLDFSPAFTEAQNSIIKLLSQAGDKNDKRKDYFVLEFSKVSKELKKNVGMLQIESSKYNFQDELSKLKETVQINYDSFLGNKIIDDIEKRMKESKNHYINILSEKQNKMAEIDNQSKSSIMKKYVSYRKSISKEKIIDLDIFFRDVVRELNSFRTNPNDFLVKMTEEYDNSSDQNDALFNSINGKRFSKLEWDCDLAEAADKYLLNYPNDYKENFKDFKVKLKDIMKEIYDYEIFDCNYILISPDEKRVMLQFFKNRQYFNNVLFDNFNLIGISGIQIKKNVIAMVINLAYYKTN